VCVFVFAEDITTVWLNVSRFTVGSNAFHLQMETLQMVCLLIATLSVNILEFHSVRIT